ncbi:MAG: cation diffusion facilitator family transporter [Oscillospiraceae bacterium]|jgi:cation diffusion facilitator family transporter|nr:cation diffusion facilitator family transporter [Oscillospiraceae bacterium]
MTEFLLRRFVKNYKDVDDPKVRGRYGKLAGLAGMLCNLLLFAGKLFAGILSGSVAITADAVNNLSDAASSLVTLIGFRLASRPADDAHPFGHARIEYITGLAVAALILLIGAELVKTSFQKILAPISVELGTLTLVILLVSIFAKLAMAVFFRNLGRRIASSALAATATDSRNDVISTLAVLLASAAGQFFGWRIDGWVGMLVALFILYSGVGIAKETVGPLLGQPADAELVRSIRSLILSHKKILGVHDLMVHDYGPGQRFASVHAEMDMREDPMRCHDIIDDIERDCKRDLRVHLVIHYDPIVTNDEELNHMRKLVEQEIHAIDPLLSTHDFRMVRGPQHTNLIFDVVIPFGMAQKQQELQRRIDERVQFEDSKYYTVITFDEAPSP